MAQYQVIEGKASNKRAGWKQYSFDYWYNGTEIATAMEEFLEIKSSKETGMFQER